MRSDAHIDPVNYRLVLKTQYRENYGAHAWDGVAPCPQYWKSKGGYDYQVATLTTKEVCDLGHSGLEKLVETLEGLFSYFCGADDYAQEYWCGWDLVEPGEETFNEECDREHMEEWARALATKAVVSAEAERMEEALFF